MGEEISTTMPEVDPVATAKTVQKYRIKHAFSRAPEYGCQVSKGFMMDSQREDIDNLSRLRDRLLETGTTSTVATIRDRSNQFHQVTVAELAEIVGELTDFGLGLYAKKWQLEAAIDAAETVEEIQGINW